MKVTQEDLIAAHEEAQRLDQENRWDMRRRSTLQIIRGSTCYAGNSCPVCNEPAWTPPTTHRS